MGFEKGKKKTGGRVKGEPNKVTADMKQRIQTFFDKNFGNFQKVYDELDGVAKARTLIELGKMVLPLQVEGTFKGSYTIVDTNKIIEPSDDGN